MNAFKQAFAKVAAKVPQGGQMPNAPKGGSTAVMVLAGLGLVGYGAFHSMVTVQPGHVGVIYNRLGGLNEKSYLTEGLNFVLPWFQRVVVFDVRTRPQPIDTHSGSKGRW